MVRRKRYEQTYVNANDRRLRVLLGGASGHWRLIYYPACTPKVRTFPVRFLRLFLPAGSCRDLRNSRCILPRGRGGRGSRICRRGWGVTGLMGLLWDF